MPPSPPPFISMFNLIKRPYPGSKTKANLFPNCWVLKSSSNLPLAATELCLCNTLGLSRGLYKYAEYVIGALSLRESIIVQTLAWVASITFHSNLLEEGRFKTETWTSPPEVNVLSFQTVNIVEGAKQHAKGKSLIATKPGLNFITLLTLFVAP